MKELTLEVKFADDPRPISGQFSPSIRSETLKNLLFLTFSGVRNKMGLTFFTPMSHFYIP